MGGSSQSDRGKGGKAPNVASCGHASRSTKPSDCRESLRPPGTDRSRRVPARRYIGRLATFPLVGLGDSAHPLASSLDAIVEPPASVEGLIRQQPGASCCGRGDSTAAQPGRPAVGARAHTRVLLLRLLQGSAEHEAWLASRVAPEHPAPRETHRRRRDSVLHMLLDRPQARNAIDRSLRDQLFEAFTVAALDPEVRSVKLRPLEAPSGWWRSRGVWVRRGIRRLHI